MANMLIKENRFVASTTKAACHCGRVSCSALRKDARRTARRLGKAAFRNELKAGTA